jgi:arginase
MTVKPARTRRLAIIGAPTSVASFSPGQEKAPAALRSAGLELRIRSAGIEVEDLGDSPVSRWTSDRNWFSGPTMARIVADVAIARDRIATSRAAGYLPLLVGGNCTLNLAMVAGTLQPDRSVGVVYFDGHIDLNTPASAPDGAADWMGVTHLLGVPGASESLLNIGPRTPLLQREQVVFLGVNPEAVTAFEKSQRQELGLTVIEVSEVIADPTGAATRALQLLPTDTDSLLVHFDVDVVDFFDLPLAENYVRWGGLPLSAAAAVLRTLCADDRFDGMTVAEMNPDHGNEDGSTLDDLVALLVDALSGSPCLQRHES